MLEKHKNITPFIFSIVLLISACTAKIFESVPTVEFKSADKTEVFLGETLVLTYSLRDKEGDISDGTIVLLKDVLNINQAPRLIDIEFPVPSGFPSIRNAEADIILDLDYFTHIGSPLTIQNDTVRFGLVIRDNAGNVSDTPYSSNIIIRKP